MSMVMISLAFDYNLRLRKKQNQEWSNLYVTKKYYLIWHSIIIHCACTTGLWFDDVKL